MVVNCDTDGEFFSSQLSQIAVASASRKAQNEDRLANGGGSERLLAFGMLALARGHRTISAAFQASRRSPHSFLSLCRVFHHIFRSKTRARGCAAFFRLTTRASPPPP